MDLGHPHLYQVWETADEVPGTRAILIGSAQPGTTEKQALAAYQSRYPGKSAIEIEHTIAHQWFMDRWPRLRTRRFSSRATLQVLAEYYAATRTNSLCWSLHGQLELGHGSSHPISKPGRRGNRRGVTNGPARIVFPSFHTSRRPRFCAWRRLPYHHPIWHVFVLAGRVSHFSAILLYLIPTGCA